MDYLVDKVCCVICNIKDCYFTYVKILPLHPWQSLLFHTYQSMPLHLYQSVISPMSKSAASLISKSAASPCAAYKHKGTHMPTTLKHPSLASKEHTQNTWLPQGHLTQGFPDFSTSQASKNSCVKPV